jgi:hypothetical protein
MVRRSIPVLLSLALLASACSDDADPAADARRGTWLEY